jgi:hypothetical protein
VVSSGNSSTTALAGSTEAEQFHGTPPVEHEVRMSVEIHN